MEIGDNGVHVDFEDPTFDSNKCVWRSCFICSAPVWTSGDEFVIFAQSTLLSQVSIILNVMLCVSSAIPRTSFALVTWVNHAADSLWCSQEKAIYLMSKTIDGDNTFGTGDRQQSKQYNYHKATFVWGTERPASWIASSHMGGW